MRTDRPTVHRRPRLRTARQLAVSLAALVPLTGIVALPAQAAPLPAPAAAAPASTNVCYPLAPSARPPLVARLVSGSADAVFAGRRLSGDQIDAARTIIDVAKEQRIERRGAVLVLAAAITATELSGEGGPFGNDKDALDGAKDFYRHLADSIPDYATTDRADREVVGSLLGEAGAPKTSALVLADALITVYWSAPAPADDAGPDATTRFSPNSFVPMPLRGAGAAFLAGFTTDSPLTTPGTVDAATAGAPPTGTPIDVAGPGTIAPPPAGPATTAPQPVITPVPTEAPVSTAPETTAPATTAPATSEAPETTTPSSDPVTTTPATPEPTGTAAPTTGSSTGSTTAPTTAPTSNPPAPSSTPSSTPRPTTPATEVPSDSQDPGLDFEPEPIPVPDDDSDPALPPAPEPEEELPAAEPLPEAPVVPVIAPDSGPTAIPAVPRTAGDCSPYVGGSTTFDPGEIISDTVFYNEAAMNATQIRAFIKAQGADCVGVNCLKHITISTPDVPADRYCRAYEGGPRQDAATVIARVSAACGINPQVMLTTLQKESGLLTRTSVPASAYDAAFGWHCPDTGPNGTANCDPAYAGFFNQAYGMAKQWSRYRLDPQKYRYQAGTTVDILWNVAESGCGSAPVTIKNVATASLYNYTPYQPNAAALASYPGTGDECSAYGNRNFFFLFQKYFGVSGGGAPAAISIRNGVDVVIPASPYVAAGLAGKVVRAPNAQVARGLAAGFASVGLPYVWGGGTNAGPADQGCHRGGGADNSCTGVVGFDCSGLTAFVMAQAGVRISTNSAGQRAGGTDVPWSAALPGDIIGYQGHVAVYLGVIDGTEYLLEAPDTGGFVQIRPVYRTNGGQPADSVLHRYWA